MGVETKRTTTLPPAGSGGGLTLLERSGSGPAFIVRQGGRTILETDSRDAAESLFTTLGGKLTRPAKK